jgi:aminoglycoside phosphotransferase (APT) family kinase protein
MSIKANTQDFDDRLAAACREVLGGEHSVEELARLSGGANMESWALRYGEHRLVLRRLPGGATAPGAELDAISLDAQAALIEVARRGGVSVPAIVACLEPRHGLGEGFLMQRVEGETLPQRILGKPLFAAAQAQLVQQCARELARIHALDPACVPVELRCLEPAQQVQEQERRYRECGAMLPVFDYAFGWLERHAPRPVAPVVLHGDFRMGNLVIDAEGIAAVLDWELAHRGDPAQDLAYLCTPSWRFGHYEKPVGGFGTIEELLEAYARESGRAIEPARLHWWLVFSTLWWGMVCLAMGQMWRSGVDRVLERTVIGRRVSEVEIDLMLLFDRGTPAGLQWTPPPAPAATGEIACEELLAASGEWVSGSVLPASAGHARFEARVAQNALGIAQRHAAWGAEFAHAEAARLATLGLDHGTLCRDLRAGRLAPDVAGVREHLSLRALERLSIDQPQYAGLREACRRWLI